MKFLAAILILLTTVAYASNTNEDIADDHVDLIELNHCYDEHGWLVFEQVIFYQWSPHKSHYNVRDWRTLKDNAQLPRRDARTGKYVAIWHDGKIIRTVTAPSFRETWTQYDPELVERQHLPRQLRGLLRKAPFQLRNE